MQTKPRFKNPKGDLGKEHLEFCRLFVDGKSPIDAYNESHNHINKVRASTYLQNHLIWDKIIEEYRKKGKETHSVLAYDLCLQETGKSPTKIFYEYCLNKRHYDKNDNDPLYPLKLTCLSFNFFYTIERLFFTNRLHKVILNDYDMICMLIKKNPEWHFDFDNFTKYLKSININFSQILKYDQNF